MAIDDPVGQAIRGFRQDAEEGADWRTNLPQLGFAALIEGQLAKFPFVASIFGQLFEKTPGRLEERILIVFEAMDEQLKRTEANLIDREYFKSDEFGTYIYFVLQSLLTTHNRRKLEMFGAALAHCADTQFQEDDKEDLLRTLRDLSVTDLRVLIAESERQERGAEVYPLATLVSLARLSGLGLIYDTYDPVQDETGQRAFQRQSNHYELSPFADQFLAFIDASLKAPKSHHGRP